MKASDFFNDDKVVDFGSSSSSDEDVGADFFQQLVNEKIEKKDELKSKKRKGEHLKDRKKEKKKKNLKEGQVEAEDEM